jgi:hypothetical protein
MIIDRIGYPPVFIAAGTALLVVGGAFVLLLDSRPAASSASPEPE